MSQVSEQDVGSDRYNRRREQLLDIATHLFGKYGLEGTTTKDIAEAAGVSPGLLYYYYSSKEDLLISVIRRFREQKCNGENGDNYNKLSLGEGLKLILTDFEEFVRKNRDLLWIIFRAAAIFPSVKDVLNEFEKSDSGGIIAFFEKKIQSGEMKNLDPRFVAKSLCHIIVMANLGGQNHDLDIDKLVDVFLTGIQA